MTEKLVKVKRTTGAIEEILEGVGLTVRDAWYDLPATLAHELTNTERWEAYKEVKEKVK